MQILDVIEGAQEGRALANLARTFAISEDEARAALTTVVPELTVAIERNTLSRGGLADLVSALGSGHHELILDEPRAWLEPSVVADGNAILTHILGSPAKVERLSDRTARASGLGGGLIEMLLPIIAQMLMGALARWAKGGLGDVVGRLPVPQSPPDPRQGRDPSRNPSRNPRDFETGGTMDDGRGFELPRVEIPREGGYPMPPLPESRGEPRGPSDRSDRQSNPRWPGGFEMPWPNRGSGSGWPGRDQPDPVQAPHPRAERRGGGLGLPDLELPREGGYPMPPLPPSSDAPMGRDDRPSHRDDGAFPLPGPATGGNPYGDLSDILRRGGSMPAGNARGDGLWGVVRGVLGSALGFGRSGIFGWILRFVVMRWGWRFLQRLLLGR